MKERFRPRKASVAVSEVLEATMNMDLSAFASAVVSFKLFDGSVAVTEDQQNEVSQVGQQKQ